MSAWVCAAINAKIPLPLCTRRLIEVILVVSPSLPLRAYSSGQLSPIKLAFRSRLLFAEDLIRVKREVTFSPHSRMSVLGLPSTVVIKCSLTAWSTVTRFCVTTSPKGLPRTNGGGKASHHNARPAWRLAGTVVQPRAQPTTHPHRISNRCRSCFN